MGFAFATYDEIYRLCIKNRKKEWNRQNGRKDYDQIVASLEQPIFGRNGLKSEESIDTAVLDFDEKDTERVEGSG